MGIPQQEVEFTFYARLKDVSQLDRLAVDKEKHEQWKIDIDTPDNVDGGARLRLVDDRRYTMTTKIKRSGSQGMEEVNADIPEALWKHLRELADTGYFKTRYTFPIPGTQLKWEVDVFYTNNGALSEWVKVDLEVANLDQPIPETPFDVEEFICANDEQLPVEDEKLIDRLWSEEWSQIKR